jgi:phage major head subunit gpT-like protein
VGAVINSAQTTGSYTDYQNYVEATLATSSISVSPVLVKQGATTQVIWSADHVVSCTVAGTNGDSWSGLQSPAQGQTSGAITAQTVYTLDCTTAIKTHLVSQATVQVIPTFQEK